MTPWWRLPGRAWFAVAVLLALGSAVALGVPRPALDWQPALAGREPWRAVSAAFVHYSTLHLIGNAAGLTLVAAYGAVSAVPARLAVAWLVAWPLTQLGLLAQPDLAHYGGASGVVHAGVAIVNLHLLVVGPRWVGALVTAGLVAKLLSESPWGEPLRHFDGFDIPIAPLVHASGVLAGTLCFLVSEAVARRRRS